MSLVSGAELVDDQRAAVREIIDAWQRQRHIAFIGPAGCGKTTTILEAVRRIRRTPSLPGANTGIMIMAPSHKAVRVIRGSWKGMRVTLQTTQKFAGVSARSSFDDEKFAIFSPGKAARDALEVIQRGRIGLVIVDECSMLSRDQAAIISNACHHGGAAVVFTGDPYQLPPVSNDKRDDDEELGPDYYPDPSGMAPEFMAAPHTIRLSTVHRYDGPIYKYATGIRNSWNELASPPLDAVTGERSSIKIAEHWESAYLHHGFDVFRQIPLQGGSPALLDQMPRALAYTNATVDRLTQFLRSRLFGPRAKDRFMDGELVTFPSYTIAETGVIHSSSDAIVVSSKIIEINDVAPPHKYKTDKLGIEREIPLAFAGRFQELTVQLIDPDNTVCTAHWGKQVVIAPIIGDTGPLTQYKAMRAKLMRVRIPEDDFTWIRMKKWKRCLTKINSAFVMTVHKSQGSTFRNVYVSDDICREQERLKRNPLLYVAATRASESITFGR